jgi:hypothetical protein
MSEEFLTGLITGVLATTIGFGLTMLWDLWKLHREDRRKTTAVLLAIVHELKENLEIVKVNRQFLEVELPILKEGKHLIGSTLPFKHGMWDLLKVNLPAKLLQSESLLAKLRDLSLSASHLNEGMYSRQIYRDTSSNNTAFGQNMKGRNATLIAEMDELSKDIDGALTGLAQLSSSSEQRDQRQA